MGQEGGVEDGGIGVYGVCGEVSDEGGGTGVGGCCAHWIVEHARLGNLGMSCDFSFALLFFRDR